MTYSSFLQDELKISEQIDGDKVVLQLSGALSVTTVPYFREVVQPYLEQTFSTIVLDFEGITKIVSRGVGAAIDMAVQAKKQGGKLRLINVGKYGRSLYIQGVHLVADVPELEGFEP
ncbi:STAS domain-containing protein [Pseudanabaena sp. PCC 6802]|uniref:STAS domain-containing protein n=1 Tax=Pseudanabaena sp. PCC 6802 TaxID=118173 RepID=UPI0003487E00|nr:STAS domain-containing protein [Pseudanabaena sp. PCC 6802]